MIAFEIKTDKSDYPMLVIAPTLEKAIFGIDCDGLDSYNIKQIERLDRYTSSNIKIINND